MNSEERKKIEQALHNLDLARWKETDDGWRLIPYRDEADRVSDLLEHKIGFIARDEEGFPIIEPSTVTLPQDDCTLLYPDEPLALTVSDVRLWATYVGPNSRGEIIFELAESDL